jgi:Thiamine pyrophosphate enzyme, C-terminal TPP binding domain
MITSLRIDDAVQAIADARTDEVAVLTMSGLGLWAEPRDQDFRIVGLMGAAASVGLGIAIGRPDQDVWVLDGDGSLLMQLGVLAAVGDAAPPRLTHIVLSNGVYAISGGQTVPGRNDWPMLATGAGYRSAQTCRTAAELTQALLGDQPGPRMIVVECDPERGRFQAGSFLVNPAVEAARVRATLAARVGVLPTGEVPSHHRVA